jgi:hypothetical protein
MIPNLCGFSSKLTEKWAPNHDIITSLRASSVTFRTAIYPLLLHQNAKVNILLDSSGRDESNGDTPDSLGLAVKKLIFSVTNYKSEFDQMCPQKISIFFAQFDVVFYGLPCALG